MKTYSVQFEPEQRTVEVVAGATILAAANKAGVFVNSLCGGDGACGRCRVVVRQGRVEAGSTEFFTREEIRSGYVLACEAKVASDLVVEVPPETRLSGPVEYVEGEVPELGDLSRRRGGRLAPLVRKTPVHLPPPDLSNNVADLQRLEAALAQAGVGRHFQMGLKVTQRLPSLLRREDWHVTAVTGYRGPLTEIIDVEGGDTSRRNFCIAADIGTTTVVCHLVDLHDAQTLGQSAKYNTQAAFGADVIHRIIHASKGPDSERALRQAVVDDLNDLTLQLLAQHRLGPHDVTLLSAAGNTTMTHLLLGLPAENIRKEPYVGAAYVLPPFRAAEIGLQINPRGLLYCMPSVAAFVGGDVIAGILATGMSHGHKIRMLIDIGTNGEIVVGSGEFLVCASASAGPAFEGAGCHSGMRATRGAIDHIRLSDARHVLSFSTIGSAPPVGICGTGYVDLIAEMLRTGVIDRTGKLLDAHAGHRVRTGPRGETEYLVVPASQTANGKDVVVSQVDINNILRAKGAIFAAAKVLLRALNMTFDDISEILVAGAFGNFLNIENAQFIGLLPDVKLERLRFVGNTSLAGAKLCALSERSYQDILRIASATTYFELSTEPTFMDEFVSACFLPHTDLGLFPRVMAALAKAK